ncbi:MAG: hypothetical protein ACI9YL_000913 [Luteibaculaceae bacterium]|jgi:hypothetical protein
MRLLSLLLVFSVVFSAKSQNFFVVDSVVDLEKSIDFGVVHWYGQLTNTTNNDLDLEWTFESLSAFPSAWVINWDIAGDYYTDIQKGAQEEFVLPANALKQKVIIGIDHMDEPGYGELRFCFREVGSPDCEYLIFKVEITGGKPDAILELDNPWILVNNGHTPELRNAEGLTYSLLDNLGRVYDQGIVNSSLFKLPRPASMNSAILRFGPSKRTSIPILWSN